MALGQSVYKSRARGQQSSGLTEDHYGSRVGSGITTPYEMVGPQVLGLPAKFQSWRPDQWDAVRRAHDSGKRWVFVCAPTGFGKSPAYVANALLAAAEGKRTCILTSTKGLQDQLMSDFEEVSSDIRGMGAYRCVAANPDDTDATVDAGKCHMGEPCEFASNGCHYFDAVRWARAASVVVTNYAKWFTLYGQDPEKALGKFDLLICDEAHDAPEQLMSALSVEWTHSDSVVAQIKQADRAWTMSIWREMALATAERVNDRIERREYSGIRQLKDLKRVYQKLSRMCRMNPDRWVMEWVDTRKGRGIGSTAGPGVVKFDPVDPRDHANMLWQGVGKTILYSATVRHKTAQILGLGEWEAALGEERPYDFYEYRSTFPGDRHPIITIPTVRMSHRTSEGELRQWLARIDQIIGTRTLDGRKGVVHSVSYKRARYIIGNSAYGGIMAGVGASEDQTAGVFGELRAEGEQSSAPGHRGDTKEFTASAATRRIIGEFKRHPGPRVLVTPSATTGYDFPYSECEFQVIGKIPFPDTRAGVMKARAALDPELPSYIAAQNLVQMTGRGMRAADDRCEDFIIDSNIEWFMRQYKAFLPAWWRELVRTERVIPGVPPKL